MELEEFIQKIRHYFAYLFEQYGFSLVYAAQHERRPGYVLVGLESSQSRITFEHEAGEFAYLMGLPTAPFGDNRTTTEIPQWFSIEWLIDFVKQRHTGIAPPLAEDTPEDFLPYYAEQLRPYCREVCQLFQSQEAVAQWYPEYQTFMAQQLSSDL